MVSGDCMCIISCYSYRVQESKIFFVTFAPLILTCFHVRRDLPTSPHNNFTILPDDPGISFWTVPVPESFKSIPCPIQCTPHFNKTHRCSEALPTVEMLWSTTDHQNNKNPWALVTQHIINNAMLCYAMNYKSDELCCAMLWTWEVAQRKRSHHNVLYLTACLVTSCCFCFVLCSHRRAAPHGRSGRRFAPPWASFTAPKVRLTKCCPNGSGQQKVWSTKCDPKRSG